MTPKNVPQSTPPNTGASGLEPGAHHESAPGRVASREQTPDGVPSRSERRELTAQLMEELSRTAGRRRDALVEEIVLINRPVAWSVASRFTDRGIERDDVRQVAVVGLYKAVVRFVPEAQRDLLSFAVPTITGEIRRWFRDHGWIVRPPRRLQELQQHSGRVVERLGHQFGRTPTAREVAAELGVSESEHLEAEAVRGAFRAASLDVPVREGGANLGDLLPQEGDEFAAAQARVVLEPALRTLNGQEARLIDLRFGGELSQGEIGRELGISQAQVSRTLAKVLTRLRVEIEGGPD